MCTSDENERAQVGELISDLVRDLEVSGGASVCTVCVCVHTTFILDERMRLWRLCPSACVCVCVGMIVRKSKAGCSKDLISHCTYTGPA